MHPFKVSIVIPVFNSHEIVARQVKYFAKMGLPDSVEIIIVDDGSNPPLNYHDYSLNNLVIIHTFDKRPWTQGLARNTGARTALGEYLFMTDIDHILSRSAINEALTFTGDKMIFPRHFGVLLPDGTLTQDIPTLEEYGFDKARIPKRGLYASYHGNTFAMKKETFGLLGGYEEVACTYGFHPASRKGEDCIFNKAWNRYAAKQGILPHVGPSIYMFPIGRYHKDGDLNPMGLFHGLSQEQFPQPMKE